MKTLVGGMDDDPRKKHMYEEPVKKGPHERPGKKDESSNPRQYSNMHFNDRRGKSHKDHPNTNPGKY